MTLTASPPTQHVAATRTAQQHHVKAAECHELAASEHHEAARMIGTGDHNGAQVHVELARAYTEQACEHAKQADRRNTLQPRPPR